MKNELYSKILEKIEDTNNLPQKKRINIILSFEQNKKLDFICNYLDINKTDFLKNSIDSTFEAIQNI